MRSLMLCLLTVMTVNAQADSCLTAAEQADLTVMQNHDKQILFGFYAANLDLLARMEAEAILAVEVVKKTFLDDPNFYQKAKNVKDGYGYTAPIDLRMIGADIHRKLPRALMRNGFYWQRNGKLERIPTDPESLLRQMEVGYVASGYYLNGITRSKNSLNDIVINQQYPIFGNRADDRKPYELAVYATYQSPKLPTTLPATQLNGGVAQPDTYHIEYQSQPLLVDLSLGQVRVIKTPGPDFQRFDEKSNFGGSARVVSKYMHQRWALEDKQKKCQQ